MVFIALTPRRPSELIGDMYFALKGKRSQLDTSNRKGAYATNRYKPVWEKRRLQSDNGDEDAAEAETAALATAFNSGFPLEVQDRSPAETQLLSPNVKAWCLTAHLASSPPATVAAGHLRLPAVPRPCLRRPR